MSNIPTIESTNLSISTIFHNFYIVPDFQREYVWKKEHVQKLLEDLFEGLGLDEGDTNISEYFLGSIVVYPDSTNDKQTFQLIDGQQRLTTIYLIFCVIRDSIKNLGDNSKAIEGYLQGTTQNTETGEDIDKPRLCLQYDSFGQKVINDYILNGKEPDKLLLQSSASADNIAKAWKVIKNFLAENLEEDIKLYKKVSTAIANRTKLIRIETPNLTNALKVFETINERGIGLTPVDLLKNYLFIHTAKEKEKDRHWYLAKKWEELLKLLYENKQQPLQFLRYYLMSHYEVDLSNSFPEEEIYDWFIKYGEKQGIQSNPLKFLNDLILAANHYCKFAKGKNTDDSDNVYLKAIGKIQGRVKAHLVLLLGGHLLEIALFEKLSNYIENLFFIISITRKTRRKDFNLTREFAIWSRDLRSVKTIEDLDDFFDKRFIPQMKELKEEFEQSVGQTSGSNLAKYRLRYLLAKITQYIEQKSFGNNSEPLDFYLDKSITIEHILPQSKQDSYSSKLGNLTLLEKTINSSISDKDYPDKLSGYRQSKILLTRSLAEKLHVGNDTQVNRTMIDLGLINFATWDHNSIDQRQKILVNIAMKVWGLDNC